MLFSRLKNYFAFTRLCQNPLEAIEGVTHGSFLLVGGFGFCGVPMNLINAVRLSGASNLTIASNSCGVDGKKLEDDWGLSMLLRTRQIKRLIFSHLGQNVQAQRQYFNGEIQLEVCPQGTFAQKLRSGGAGVPAFYTPTGVGTVVETGGYVVKYRKTDQGLQPEEVTKPKSTKMFKNKKYLEEQSIYGDFALIKAWKADKLGNLEFHKTARNFNADMAKTAKCVIAEVEHLVEPGELDPEAIHVPGMYVDRLYKMDPSSRYSESVIERLTLADHVEVKRGVSFSLVKDGKLIFNDHPSTLDGENIRYKIAARAAKQVRDGMNINLGIGIPTILPEVLPKNVRINIQSENGVIGVGHHPLVDEVDPDNINAGKVGYFLFRRR